MKHQQCGYLMKKNPMIMIFVIVLFSFFTLGCLNVSSHNNQNFENNATIQSLIAEQTGMIVTFQ